MQYQYNPKLRNSLSLPGCILYDYLARKFQGQSHLELSKRFIMEELGFSVAEINQAFKDLVKEYKSSTEYKKAQDRFDGYLYCAYTFRGRGASAYTTYIFKNGVTAQTALKPIESVNRDSVFTSSTRVSTQDEQGMAETITLPGLDGIHSPLKPIESVNRDSVFTSSTRVSTQKNQEIAETITESQSQPLKPIESVNRNSVFTSSMRTSGGKVHPYRDINNIYILSLDQEKESVEQMNQNMKLPQDTPPTPPPLVRKRNGIKGTEMSCFPADPWMVSANNPKPEFANWVLEQNKRKRPEATLPDAKAEIRNNYVRAGDLWLEFQKAIALDEKLALEKLALEESRPQLEPEPQPQPVAFDHKAARLAIVRKINQTT
jgi:hypothetical protein